MDEQGEIEDGGPAFPQIQHVGTVCKCEGGMTIRDYFAGQTLNAFVSNAELIQIIHAAAKKESPEDTLVQKFRTVAAYAYGYADAMLGARKS